MRELAIGVVVFVVAWGIGVGLCLLLTPLIPLFALAAVGALAWWLLTPSRTHPPRRSTRG